MQLQAWHQNLSAHLPVREEMSGGAVPLTAAEHSMPRDVPH